MGESSRFTESNINFIFDDTSNKVIDKKIGDFNSPSRKIYYFHESPETIEFGDVKYPDTALVTINQFTGKIEVSFDSPSDPKSNELFDDVIEIIKGLKSHVRNLKKESRNNKEKAGQEFAIAYEKITGQSAKPGTGPANTIRRFANIQPPINLRRTPIQKSYNLSLSTGFKRGGTYKKRGISKGRKRHTRAQQRKA